MPHSYHTKCKHIPLITRGKLKHKTYAPLYALHVAEIPLLVGVPYVAADAQYNEGSGCV